MSFFRKGNICRAANPVLHVPTGFTVSDKIYVSHITSARVLPLVKKLLMKISDEEISAKFLSLAGYLQTDICTFDFRYDIIRRLF